MDRRQFIRASGTVSAASLITAVVRAAATEPATSQATGHVPGQASRFDPARVWHFFDRWCFDHCDQLMLCQGRGDWQPDATFNDPNIGNLSAWPTVFQDEATGRWRMLYSAAWKPYQLMIAQSDDGRHWQPLPQPNVQPEGDKIAPHHLFTLPAGSGGGVYIDPIAADGFRFKVYVHQKGKPVSDRAQADPQHPLHDLAKRVGPRSFLNDDFTLVSADAIHWQARRDLSWSLPDWHPEPPIFGYYHRDLKRHMMTVRPGWGDRRQCRQSSVDFQTWSGPQLLLQPDFLDDELIELYGMPVFPYGDGYVGLLWIFHCESTEPTRGYNRFVGPLDCQLALSHDGLRFDRGQRQPIVAVGDPGTAIGGAVEPSCLVETDDEIRIYSSASQVHHGRSGDAKKRGVKTASIALHTLRKDGLTYLQAGDWGRFVSKPLVLFADQLRINAAAPDGEVLYQLTDIESRPVEGYTFEECRPLQADDQYRFPLIWKSARLDKLVGKIVRLEVRMRHARLYAIRGQFHFIDAQDRSLLQAGEPIRT